MNSQQQLIEAIFYAETGSLENNTSAQFLKDLSPAISAYQGNARATVARSCEITYPLACRAVGSDFLAELAWEFFSKRPDSRADWALFSEGLADSLEGHPALTDNELYYLNDLLRLDWLKQRVERAADSELDLESLALLEEHDPEHLCFTVGEDVALLSSSHPLMALAQLNETSSDQASAKLIDELKQTIRQHYSASPATEYLVVFRDGYRALLETIDRALYQMLSLALQRARIKDIVEVCERDANGSDFASLFQLCLSRGWIKGVEFRAKPNS